MGPGEDFSQRRLVPDFDWNLKLFQLEWYEEVWRLMHDEQKMPILRLFCSDAGKLAAVLGKSSLIYYISPQQIPGGFQTILKW